MADQKRLLELALKGLEVERRRIDEEIEDVQKQLRGGGGQRQATRQRQPAKPVQRKSRLSAAGRKALSDAMKRRWAVKKKAAGKATK